MATIFYYDGDNQWLQSFDYFERDEMGVYIGVYADKDGERHIPLTGSLSREIEQHINREVNTLKTQE